MKVGFHVPQWGPDSTGTRLVAAARAVEAAGLDSVWVADHIVFPTSGAKTYPYRDRTPFSAADGFLEALTTLAMLASVTDSVRLGTSVLVLPMRDTITTAKIAATIDVLSGGRLDLGIGAGWWQEEFSALGQPFEGRGARLDEQLGVVRQLWGGEEVAHHGPTISFDRIVCAPQPTQPGGPPLLVGGLGARARQRAATLGDGWHAAGSHLPTLSEGMADVRRRAEVSGRDPRVLSFGTSIELPDRDDAACRRLERLKAAGLDYVVLKAPGDDDHAVERATERLITRVMTRISLSD